MLFTRFALLALFVAACPSKGTPPRALDKDGIQRRSDQVHEDLNREEGRAADRKADE